HRRVYRGLFKCYKHSKVFNTDLVGAYNILLKTKTISLSPALHGVNPETGNVAPNLPRTLALYGWEEVRTPSTITWKRPSSAIPAITKRSAWNNRTRVDNLLDNSR
ncbi:MAG: hypothetical protein QXI86_04975, partial [Ignisphaera sp.]